MYKLFLVEDDKGITDGIVTLAGAWGYEVVCCRVLCAIYKLTARAYYKIVAE